MIRLRTYYFEVGFVAAVVGATTALTATRAVDWVAAAAVLGTFKHAQIADRLAEAQGALAAPAVECYRLAAWYWALKESLWFTFFLIQGSYAAVAGAIVFALYPVWRRAWRRFHPRTEGLPS